MIKYHYNGIKHTKHCTHFLYENPLKKNPTIFIYIVLSFTMLSASRLCSVGMYCDLRIGKDLEGNSVGVIELRPSHLSEGTEENYKKNLSQNAWRPCRDPKRGLPIYKFGALQRRSEYQVISLCVVCPLLFV
jgi:hypothetical protein